MNIYRMISRFKNGRLLITWQSAPTHIEAIQKTRVELQLLPAVCRIRANLEC